MPQSLPVLGFCTRACDGSLHALFGFNSFSPLQFLFCWALNPTQGDGWPRRARLHSFPEASPNLGSFQVLQSMSTGVVHLDPSRFRCLCGFCHVVVSDTSSFSPNRKRFVFCSSTRRLEASRLSNDDHYRTFGFQTGTQVCLVWYVVCSVFSLLFGMRSTLTWLIVPICVVILGVYAIISKRHKYLYPFLIITVGPRAWNYETVRWIRCCAVDCLQYSYHPNLSKNYFKLGQLNLTRKPE